MIAKLAGVLDSAGEDWAVVDVGGVGYLVHCSARALARLPRPGEAVAFAVETHVREDHIRLYGFLDPAERGWFRQLVTVQGVGARAALAILSALGPAELAAAVAAQDRKTIARAQGVGPKIAARIAAELKDKIGSLGEAAAPAAGGAAAVLDQAVSALVNLGYRRVDAYGAVAGRLEALGGDASVEELVRAGLRELGA